ncbi:LacI family DNA-binding transcriptional regulator [Marinobacterium rhizophilum]|uniref:Substrate-binding domain-containing protein n=1 Tax=Marinobacterium rhizophilum TaxID=420402 RepID=A0ABY5HIW5_9GAMM|nr:substrate-binding domain-containing protein [Marinobacterium rhizophilum]UTW11222.1 substrate-binding domain-containing protein [Marinobacterium rhizophilum]
MAKGVNLKSLAKELGISVTTVSRALADYDDVSSATKQKVKDKAQQLGYRPNHAARRLVTGRSSAVGFIMHGAYGDFRDQFNSRLIVSLSQALHDVAPNHDLIITTVPQDKSELDTYKRFVDSGRVDSFIVSRTQIQDPRVDYLLSQGVHFVTHGRTADAEQHCWVDTNAELGFRQATESLIQRGHRRIVFLNFPQQLNTAVLRQSGYQAAMQAAGLPGRMIHCEFGTTCAYEPVRAMLAEPLAPTAFVCASDVYAYAVLQACLDLGLMPGKDVSIFGSDNLPPVDSNRPQLSTLDVSFSAVSHAIINLLLDQAASSRSVIKHKLFDYHLLERNSTGPCPANVKT